MELFLQIVKLVSGPLIGAVIGIFTNYIAVKMLFRPRHEVRIGKFRLPFTPGIIPRRKAALANAVGHAVGDSLVKKEDLKKALLSDEVCNVITKGLMAMPGLRETGEALLGEGYADKKEAVLDALTDRIVTAITAMDMGAVIAAEGANAVNQLAAKNPLIGMFVNEATVQSLAAPLAEKVNDYVNAEGRHKVRESLAEQIDAIERKPLREFVGGADEMKAVFEGVYRTLITRHADAIAAQFKIAQIVENKINAMPAEDLEALVLAVMKKELNAVIWLGGIIGLVLGGINLISML